MLAVFMSDQGRFHVVNTWTGTVLPSRKNMKGFRSERAATRFANKRVRHLNKTIAGLSRN